jgi:membrane associated rhomboid family serine protease
VTKQVKDPKRAPIWRNHSLATLTPVPIHRDSDPPNLIPISDENPTLHTPVMTWIILGTIFAVWMTAQGAGMAWPLIVSVCDWGLVPGEITRRAELGLEVPMAPGVACVVDDQAKNLVTPVTSMFLHGSWGHLLGNVLFFWVFGNNVEDSMGPGRFIVFYLICGLAAAATHVFIDPASPIPTVGASGAIAGVLGAYLVMYPRVRVNMLWLLGIVSTPAWLVLIWWFIIQLLSGLPQLTPMRPESSTGGVAVWAHIGGFVAGVALIRLFENRRMVAERNAVRIQTVGH